MSERSLPRRLSLCWTVLAVAAALSAAPAAACSARVGAVSATPITYDPFTLGDSIATLRVGVDLVEGDRCDTAIVLTDDSGAPLRNLGFGPTRSVTFQTRLRPTGSVRTSTDDAEALVTLTSDRPHVDVEWQLQNVGDDVLPPGDYSVPVRVRMRDAADPVGPAIGAVTLRSIARAQINLAGTTGGLAAGSDAATIDLGELRTGGTGRAFLQLRANTAAHLAFTSRNRGRLVAAAGTGSVPYSLSFDGRPVALAQTDTRTLPPPPTIRGAAYDMTVTIGDVAGAPAGRYSDTVTIDVSP